MTDEDPASSRPATALTRVVVRGLIAFQPAHAPRWPVALQAALSMFLPVMFFTLIGQPGVGMMAAGGAFTAIYLVGAAPSVRIRLLPVVGMTLIACAALGTVLAPFPLLAAVGLVLVTVGVSALYYAVRVGPPGPVFFVLVYGLATRVTGEVDGHRLVHPLVFLGALALGVVVSYAVAAIAMLIGRIRHGAHPGGGLRLERRPRLDAEQGALVIRIALVAVIGTVLSVLVVDPARGYWVVCAGVAVVGVNAGRRVALVRGSQRFVGTVVGAALFTVLALLPIPSLLLPALLGVLQFSVEIFVVRNYALALVFITPLVLFIITAVAGLHGTLTIALVGERVVDTLVGAVLGAVTGVVHPRDRRTALA
ncbi:FUSC family protein [uncultured Microbacterium sp.]|uniref:FUSC family protein n=1 Tax=uncultured Microbacterium sp. TaxID=191216 RepID=UPI0025CCBB52|nr:FUSC family protein [uncultured Microbacterium sp.]